MKIFIKWNFLGFVTRVLVFFFGARVNKDGWEDRVLIVDLHGIGDVIIATPVLRYYRKHFAGKKLYFLVAQKMSKDIFGDDIDVLLTVDSRKFGLNPWYALKEINRLRAIGFATVIDECLGIKEKASKVVSVSLGATNVTGYEGPGVELANPESAPYRRFAKKHVIPRYTTFVPSIDKDFQEKGTGLKSSFLHHLAICQAVTGRTSFPDVSTVFHVDQASIDSARAKLATLDASGKKYVAFVPGASDGMKRWEIEKFAEVAHYAHERGFEIVVLGSPSEYALGEALREKAACPVINAAKGFSLLESAGAIKGAYCLVTNDTGPVHIAIALGVPSICIPAAAHLGMNSFFGREGINRWVYKDIGCLYDDWRCAETVPAGDPAPCIAAVQAEDVIREFDSLEKYLTSHPVRNEPFVAEFKTGAL